MLLSIAGLGLVSILIIILESKHLRAHEVDIHERYGTRDPSSRNLNMAIKTMQNFTLISKLLRKMLKICYRKSYRQKKGAKLGIFLFYTTNLQKFLANNFFWVHFFQLFPRI
jgi:hypothetical protein